MVGVPAFSRYTIVAFLGFGVDLAAALILSRALNAHLVVSAVTGFAVALCLNYVLFEFWVFREEGSRLSAARLLKTVVSAIAALTVRVAVVWGLGGRLGDTLVADAFVLAAAAGASFAVNFLCVRLVFAAR